MRTLVQDQEPRVTVVAPNRGRKLRVVLADGSDQYMKIVMALLDLHERIDLIGRAANLNEATSLVVNRGPDLLLLDLDMRLASLVVPAVVLSSRTQLKIVGLCIDETISFRQLDCITGVNVLVHRSRFQQEFLSVVNMLYRPDVTNSKPHAAQLLGRARNRA
jgi:DNA-binding NarL/FixJ family response regulator